MSAKPAKNVTVRLNQTGTTGVSVSRGQTLNFTPSDWNKTQQVTVAGEQGDAATGSHATLTASAAGLRSASVGVTAAAAAATGYDQ